MSIKPRRPRKINKGINSPNMITIDTGTATIKKYDQFEFLEGTDTSIIGKHLVKGYASRQDMMKAITAEIKSKNGLITSRGNRKNISSLVHGVIGRLKEKGYTVESMFVMVPSEGTKIHRSTKKKSIKRL